MVNGSVRQRLRGGAARYLIGALVLLDVALLSAVLYWYGGHTNPFSLMYLAHVVLAALLLGGRWPWLVLALSALGYTALFFRHHPVEALAVHHHGGDNFSLHLYGMLWAFLLIGALLAFALNRVSAELRRRREQLELWQARAAEEQKLLALTSLAASAAHELGTPLGTIAVAAHEMRRELARRSAADELISDAALIEEELARCQAILRDMSSRAGEITGEMPEPVAVTAVIERAVALLDAGVRPRVRWSGDALGESVSTFREALASTIRSLIKNALEASPVDSPVTVTAERRGGAVCFVVRDHGTGIAPELRGCLGEPFSSTKAPGQGLGLGVFLARLFARRIGGEFTLSDHPDRGAEAMLLVPDLRGAV